MSDPYVGALNQSVPPQFTQEPIASETPPAEPLVCVDASSGGSEGASGAGTEALVRQFSGSNGTEGTSGSHAASPALGESCAGDAFTAAGACGTTLYLAGTTGGLGVLFTGLSCLGAVEGLIECLDRQAAASKP
jgi:hypothetical protein